MVLIFLQIVDNHAWWCLITLKVLFLIKGCSITWVCKTVAWTEYYNKYYYVSIRWYCSFDEWTCKNKILDTHSSLRWQGFIIPNVCEVNRINESCYTTLKKIKNKKQSSYWNLNGKRKKERCYSILRAYRAYHQHEERRERKQVSRNFEMETFQFFDLSNMRIQNSTMEQDHLRMNIAPDINNHLRSIELMVSLIYH